MLLLLTANRKRNLYIGTLYYNPSKHCRITESCIILRLFAYASVISFVCLEI